MAGWIRRGTEHFCSVQVLNTGPGRRGDTLDVPNDGELVRSGILPRAMCSLQCNGIYTLNKPTHRYPKITIPMCENNPYEDVRRSAKGDGGKSSQSGSPQNRTGEVAGGIWELSIRNFLMNTNLNPDSGQKPGICKEINYDSQSVRRPRKWQWRKFRFQTCLDTKPVEFHSHQTQAKRKQTSV